MLQYSHPTNERQKMVTVEHSLKFVTEFDETHPVSQQFLSTFDEHERIMLLESMLKDLIAPSIKPLLNEINENGTYAILKLI
jgi:F0F1-type ATP synthase delta subunit